jgi:hypothetical protein
VCWGTRAPARWAARLCGLPRPGADVAVELDVDADVRGETWRRTFGGRPFATRQWSADGRHLLERFGPLELRFVLRADDGGLRFEPRGTAVRLLGLRLALPAALGPRVDACVRAVGARLQVEVELRAPLLGRLCRYAGWLEPSV